MESAFQDRPGIFRGTWSPGIRGKMLAEIRRYYFHPDAAFDGFAGSWSGKIGKFQNLFTPPGSAGYLPIGILRQLYVRQNPWSDIVRAPDRRKTSTNAFLRLFPCEIV